MRSRVLNYAFVLSINPTQPPKYLTIMQRYKPYNLLTWLLEISRAQLKLWELL